MTDCHTGRQTDRQTDITRQRIDIRGIYHTGIW